MCRLAWKLLRSAAVFAACLSATLSPVHACTIFVLVDEHRSLFCNNEDWFNVATRLWFVPAGEGHLGCAFIGFDDGWAQGGVNEAGLAFDWVSGFEESYEPAPDLRTGRGNPSERMLESCRNVDEAIEFYRTYREPDFRRSRILIADRGGASVVIGARNGELLFVQRRDSRGFGYARAALERELAKSPAPRFDHAADILRTCVQPGEGGTKYSNIFDLKTGDLVLLSATPGAEAVTLNLGRELEQGGHYYDLPRLRAQLESPLQPLLPNQQRFYLDTFSPLPDPEPAIAARVRALLDQAAAGQWNETEFVPTLWRELAPQRAALAAELRQLGTLRSLTPVERGQDARGQWYRFIADFDRARVLSEYVFTAEQKIAGARTEFAELKPEFSARHD